MNLRYLITKSKNTFITGKILERKLLWKLLNVTFIGFYKLSSLYYIIYNWKGQINIHLGVFIGSGLVGFELNWIRLDQTVRFPQFNGSVRFVFLNWIITFVRFGLKIFKIKIIEPTELLYIMNLACTAPVYFLINCFKYFGLFLNILV